MLSLEVYSLGVVVVWSDEGLGRGGARGKLAEEASKSTNHGN